MVGCSTDGCGLQQQQPKSKRSGSLKGGRRVAISYARMDLISSLIMEKQSLERNGRQTRRGKRGCKKKTGWGREIFPEMPDKSSVMY